MLESASRHWVRRRQASLTAKGAYHCWLPTAIQKDVFGDPVFWQRNVWTSRPSISTQQSSRLAAAWFHGSHVLIQNMRNVVAWVVHQRTSYIIEKALQEGSVFFRASVDETTVNIQCMHSHGPSHVMMMQGRMMPMIPMTTQYAEVAFDPFDVKCPTTVLDGTPTAEALLAASRMRLPWLFEAGYEPHHTDTLLRLVACFCQHV